MKIRLFALLFILALTSTMTSAEIPNISTSIGDSWVMVVDKLDIDSPDAFTLPSNGIVIDQDDVGEEYTYTLENVMMAPYYPDDIWAQLSIIGINDSTGKYLGNAPDYMHWGVGGWGLLDTVPLIFANWDSILERAEDEITDAAYNTQSTIITNEVKLDAEKFEYEYKFDLGNSRPQYSEYTIHIKTSYFVSSGIMRHYQLNYFQTGVINKTIDFSYRNKDVSKSEFNSSEGPSFIDYNLWMVLPAFIISVIIRRKNQSIEFRST
ncbi:MAG: hypothetical protein HeimC2_31940 [Candidatus Heimdallarchaeota archaeon LC_2]|nr:MAG: hypothetical protein HeimC2_31940 [Candidatus Heimdallarchaeota archaeon LC_2]